MVWDAAFVKVEGKSEGKRFTEDALVLLFSIFKLGSSVLLGTVILKSGQEFCKMRKTHFGRKPSWGWFGKSLSPPEEGRTVISPSLSFPLTVQSLGKEWSFSTLVEVSGLFYPWCGLRTLWDSGFGR